MEGELIELRKQNIPPSTSKLVQGAINNASSSEITKQNKVIETVQSMINQVLLIPDGSAHFYKTKLKTIEQHWKHANALHEQLWTLPSYDYDAYIQIEERITNGIIDIQERIMSGETTPGISSNSSTDNNFKLPKIELPKFDGNYLKWRNFYDLFSELVDKRPLPLCQKLLYLKSSLSGEAEGFVHNYATTADNYEVAWKALKNRYENKRVLVNALLKKLLAQPASSHENVSSLKLLHDTTQECLQSLQNLGISTENWDPIILHILVQRLSKSTHVLWEQSLLDPQALPKLTDFLKFIKNRIQSLEALGDKSTQNSFPTTQNTTHTHKHIRSFGVSIPAKGSCVICEESHPLFACPSFLKKTAKERLSAVQKAKLCVNCLKAGHNAKNCSSSTCTKCKQKHNSLLHLGTNDTKVQRYSSKEEQSTAKETSVQVCKVEL